MVGIRQRAPAQHALPFPARSRTRAHRHQARPPTRPATPNRHPIVRLPRRRVREEEMVPVRLELVVFWRLVPESAEGRCFVGVLDEPGDGERDQHQDYFIVPKQTIVFQ